MIKKSFLILIPAIGILLSSCGGRHLDCREECAEVTLQSQSKCLREHNDGSNDSAILCGEIMYKENNKCIAQC